MKALPLDDFSEEEVSPKDFKISASEICSVGVPSKWFNKVAITNPGEFWTAGFVR